MEQVLREVENSRDISREKLTRLHDWLGLESGGEIGKEVLAYACT